MKLIVDGEEAGLDLEEARDLGAILHELDTRLREEGRLVCEVRCDGTAVSPDDVAGTLQRAATDSVGTLEIVTTPTAPVLQSIVHGMETAVPELPVICMELARIFHSGEAAQGYEPFNTFAEHWEEIKRLQIQALNVLHRNPADVRVGDRSLEELHNELNSHLQACVDALAKQDTIALGDILQHDLAPLAEKEAELVGWLKAEAARP